MEAGFSKILHNRDSFATIAFLAAIVALDYDLEKFEQVSGPTLLDEIDRRLGRPMPPESRSKIMAVQVAYQTDLVYKSLPVFINFCNLLAERSDIDPNVFDPADAYEIAWAMTELVLVDPPQEETLVQPDYQNPFMRAYDIPEKGVMEFSEEIRKYMGQALFVEGAIEPIPLIPMAIMPREIEFNDEATFLAAQESQKQVDQSIRMYVAGMLDEYFQQIRLLRTADNRPILTEQEMAALKQVVLTIESQASGSQSV